MEVVLGEGMKIPSAGPYVLLFNHSSYLDIFVLASVVSGLRFGAKSELFRIPLFGWAMRVYGILPIHRGDRERAKRHYQRAKHLVARGEKFALAPEGTRSRSESELLPLKSGPFYFAIENQLPLVIVRISGAQPIWSKGDWWPKLKGKDLRVNLEVRAIIPTMGLALEDRNHLKVQVAGILAQKPI